MSRKNQFFVIVLSALGLLALLSLLGCSEAPVEVTVMQSGAEETDYLLLAIMERESNSNPTPKPGLCGEIGILQILPIFVRDCNRILGWEKFDLNDRWDIQSSVDMYYIYMGNYCRGASDELKARRFNGGPKGETKKATLKYWRDVQKIMERLKHERGQKAETKGWASTVQGSTGKTYRSSEKRELETALLLVPCRSAVRQGGGSGTGIWAAVA